MTISLGSAVAIIWLPRHFFGVQLQRLLRDQLMLPLLVLVSFVKST